MRQPWRWYVLASIAALAACDDDEDEKTSRVQVEVGDVCPGEEAVLFVDGKSYFGGDAGELLSSPADVPAGNRQVRVFIDGAVVLDEKVNLPAGKTVTLDLGRTVTCSDGDGADGDGMGDGVDGDGGDGDGVDGGDGDGDMDGGVDGGDGDGADGGDGDGDGDAGTVTLLDPCTYDDNLREDAQRVIPGSYDDALCGEGDVDFFAFQVGADKLATLTLSTAAEALLNGEITLYDQNGVELDVQAQNGEDATTSFLLFGSETYYVKVADLAAPDEPLPADAGVPDGGIDLSRPYALSLTLVAETPTTEAAAGTFHGSTNDADQPGLQGSYVATSVHGADDAVVAYKTLVRVRLPGTSTQQFVFDPAIADDGVLRVVFYDGLSEVRRLVNRANLVRLPFAGWYGRPTTGARLRAGFTGNVRVSFPTASFTRAVAEADTLALPTVSAVAATGATLAVTSVRPAGATLVEATAFTSQQAARGVATPTAGTFDLTLSAALDPGEDFTVYMRAASAGMLELPLPEVSNLSEFIYYSAEQE